MEGRIVTSVRETRILHYDEARERGSHACDLTYKERGEKVWYLATLRVRVNCRVYISFSADLDLGEKRMSILFFPKI